LAKVVKEVVSIIEFENSRQNKIEILFEKEVP
jgi:hypothetical protein